MLRGGKGNATFNYICSFLNMQQLALILLVTQLIVLRWRGFSSTPKSVRIVPTVNVMYVSASGCCFKSTPGSARNLIVKFQTVIRSVKSSVSWQSSSRPWTTVDVWRWIALTALARDDCIVIFVHYLNCWRLKYSSQQRFPWSNDEVCRFSFFWTKGALRRSTA